MSSPRVEKLAAGLWMVEYDGFSSLTYVLKGAREAWVVDPGSGQPEEVIEGLRQAGLTPEQVTRAFITHCHFDHSANAHLFPNAIVHGSAFTLQRLQRNDPVTFLPEVGMRYQAEQNKHEPLADGQAMQAEGLELRCVHTPGHVADAVIYHAPALNTVFSGDSLFTAPSLPRLFEPPAWGAHELAQSLRKLESLPATTLAPGHPPLSGDFRRELRASIEALERV